MEKTTFLQNARKNAGIASLPMLDLFSNISRAAVILNATNDAAIIEKQMGNKALVDTGEKLPVTYLGKKYTPANVSAIQKTLSIYKANVTDAKWNEFQSRTGDLPTE